MASYNWIVILLCLGMFGLLYASTYDVVYEFYLSAYTSTSDASTAVQIMWLTWKYLPVICIVSTTLYGYMEAQKTEGMY